MAYVNVDEPLLPSEIHLTTDFSYFRWHGRGSKPWFDYRYRKEELEKWVPKVEKVAGKVKKAFGYFNNHYHGYAPENCLHLLEMLSILTPEQVKTKNKVDEYFKKSKLQEPKLGKFLESDKLSLEDLLRSFMDMARLKRAKTIRDNELRIDVDTAERTEASIRAYHIIIDSKTKTIQHDCADWNKALSAKRFCKHIGKLFLSMERQKATALLRTIYEQRETWQFRTYS